VNLGLRRADVYLFELVVGLAVLAGVNLGGFPRDLGFVSVSPHPALFLVGVLGVRHGLRAGLASGAILGALLYGVEVLRTDQTGLRVLWRPDTYVTPLLIVATGFALGAISEVRRRENHTLRARVGVLEHELAEQAVRFMAATEATHELERRVAEERTSLSSLYASARAMETLEIDRLYPAIVAATREFLQADACQLYVLDGEILRLRAAEGAPPENVELSIDDGLVGHAIRRGVAVSIRDYTMISSLDDLQRAPVLVAAPLIRAEGGLLGCLTVTRLPFLRLIPASVDRAAVLADWASRALENAQVHARTRASTVTDELIRTYTYAYYQRRLGQEEERAQRHGRALSVVVFRVHALALVAPERRAEFGRLIGLVFSRTLRRIDLVCRYATEDSFAIILPETSAAAAEGVAARLSSEIANFHFSPYSDDERELEFSIRVLPVRDAAQPAVDR